MLSPGTLLPEFTITDDQGREVGPEGFRGAWTVLWWYIKADTPG